jgi:hypothetical protein
VEAGLALEYLRRGLVRNAAGRLSKCLDSAAVMDGHWLDVEVFEGACS